MWLAMRQAGPEPGDPGLGFGFITGAPSWNEHYSIWGEWRLSSLGAAHLYPGGTGFGGVSFVTVDNVYDPTNGTVSLGNIHRTQRDSEGKNT